MATGLKFGSVIIESFSLNDFIYMLEATLVTLKLNGVSLLGALIIGTLLGLLRVTPFSRLLRWSAILYIEFFRSVPVLLQMFVGFFGFALIGINLQPFFVACVILILWSSGYIAEVVRGSIEAIPTQQWEAASSLGMTYMQVMFYVIIPQAIRIIIPPAIGVIVNLVKASSLAYVVGLTELTLAGRHITSSTFQPLIVYFFVGLIYFIICFPLSTLANVMERRLSKYVIKS